ncbi:MAG TPA: CAP domain-containing protein [Actinomycetota bacterium]|nr:CAP domain-containing protein [Actinomycetota bacterium]
MSVVKRLITASIATLLLATLFPAGTASAACYSNSRSEKRFARLINRARTSQPNLTLDPELSKAAKVHTGEMVRSNTLHHTSSDALRRRVTNWTTLGENVGVGSAVGSLHDAFMNSTAHRANILRNEYRYVGVGVTKKDGRMWVTVIFEARSNPGSPLC